MFKVGDKVRILHNSGYSFHGKIGTVDSLYKSDYSEYYRVILDDDKERTRWNCKYDYLELVSKKKTYSV